VTSQKWFFWQLAIPSAAQYSDNCAWDWIRTMPVETGAARKAPTLAAHTAHARGKTRIGRRHSGRLFIACATMHEQSTNTFTIFGMRSARGKKASRAHTVRWPFLKRIKVFCFFFSKKKSLLSAFSYNPETAVECTDRPSPISATGAQKNGCAKLGRLVFALSSNLRCAAANDAAMPKFGSFCA